MPVIPISPPLINGNYFDWSSVGIALSGGIVNPSFTGFKSIDYKSSQKPGGIWGNGSVQKIGRTPGQLDASGSFEIWRPYWIDFQRALQGPQAINNLSLAPGIAQGIHEVNFNLQVSMSAGLALGAGALTALETQTDTIIGMRITDINGGGSQGSDGLTVKCDFDAMYIAFNNAIPINQLLKAANFR